MLDRLWRVCGVCVEVQGRRPSVGGICDWKGYVVQYGTTG